MAAHDDDIARNIELTAALDLILAKARFAEKVKAVEPAITDFTPGVLKLDKARHPLLGEKAVPLSVEIGRDYSILVVTGPNMGGKTVALKTIGLLSAMALAGLPIPASTESSVPLLDGIFADIGDEQSIEQTVSTFGWHVGNIVRIVNSATDRSLVLLDELGTSTDPAEGSALARSVLLYLLSCHTMAIATTHFDDLKAFAHTTPGLRNASLDLDPATHMPTYHLTVGVPGGSNALAIAAQLGLPEKIIAGARDMLSRGSQELESLLADLSSERQKLAALREQVEKEKEALDKRAAAVSDQMKELRAEERKLVRETKDRLVLEAADLQREIRQALAELRKQKTQGRRREGPQRAGRRAGAAQGRRLAGARAGASCPRGWRDPCRRYRAAEGHECAGDRAGTAAGERAGRGAGRPRSIDDQRRRPGEDQRDRKADRGAGDQPVHAAGIATARPARQTGRRDRAGPGPVSERCLAGGPERGPHHSRHGHGDGAQDRPRDARLAPAGEVLPSRRALAKAAMARLWSSCRLLVATTRSTAGGADYAPCDVRCGWHPRQERGHRQRLLLSGIGESPWDRRDRH